MHTRPVEFFHGGSGSSPQPRFSPVYVIQHTLKYVKYGVGGALGAMSVLHTASFFIQADPSATIQFWSAIAGALLMVAAARAVKLL